MPAAALRAGRAAAAGAIADFGVARLVEKDTIMTAETGTYRWMVRTVQSFCFHNEIMHFWELLILQISRIIMKLDDFGVT